jgi:hypothetical protein
MPAASTRVESQSCQGEPHQTHGHSISANRESRPVSLRTARGFRDSLPLPRTWRPLTLSLVVHHRTLAGLLLQPPLRRVTVACVTVR